jgi:MFS family permease
MQLFNFYHDHNLQKRIHADFWLFEFSVWLHTIARSLVSVFIPIFLFELGYGVPTIIAYYLLFNCFDVPLNFAAGRLVQKIGARKVIILATVVSIAYFALLGRIVGASLIALGLLALLDAIYDSFYWVGHIYLFLNSDHSPRHDNRGTGILYGMRTFGSMLGPILGAGLLLFTSQGFLLLVSILLFIFSIFPLMDLKHIADHPHVPRIPIREFFKHPEDRKNYLSTFLTSFHAASEVVIWPLFIFTLFGTLSSVAYIAIIVSLSKIACSYVAGTIRRTQRRSFVIVGSLSLAAVWTLRIFYPVPGLIYASVLLTGLLTLLVDVPVTVGIFEHGRGMRALSTATYRNTASMSGQLTLYLILLFATNIFEIDFAIAAVAMLLLASLSALPNFKRT